MPSVFQNDCRNVIIDASGTVQTEATTTVFGNIFTPMFSFLYKMYLNFFQTSYGLHLLYYFTLQYSALLHLLTTPLRASKWGRSSGMTPVSLFVHPGG